MIHKIANTLRSRSTDRAAQIYLVGGGIASLAAAAFLIRDGDVIGRDITILEESDVIGGSLDGGPSALLLATGALLLLAGGGTGAYAIRRKRNRS